MWYQYTTTPYVVCTELPSIPDAGWPSSLSSLCAMRPKKKWWTVSEHSARARSCKVHGSAHNRTTTSDLGGGGWVVSYHPAVPLSSAIRKEEDNGVFRQGQPGCSTGQGPFHVNREFFLHTKSNGQLVSLLVGGNFWSLLGLYVEYMHFISCGTKYILCSSSGLSRNRLPSSCIVHIYTELVGSRIRYHLFSFPSRLCHILVLRS